MQPTPGKLIAVAIAFVYLVFGIVIGGWDAKSAFVMCLTMSIPLALIWFPDEIADYSGPITKYGSGRGFDSHTPAPIVLFAGWLGLIVYFPVLLYFLTRG